MKPEAVRNELGIIDPFGLIDRWPDPPHPGGVGGTGMPALVRTWAEQAGLSAIARRSIEGHAEMRWSSAAWRHFLSACAAHLYHDCGAVGELPRATTPESERGLDRLLLALTGIPTLLRNHKGLDAPTDVTEATIRDLSRWTTYFSHELGTPGITERILGWYQSHIHGRLYEVGRLQFVPSTFDGTVHVYGQREGDDLAVFYTAGARIDEDGLAPPEGERGRTCVTTTFLVSNQLTGYLVAPTGHVDREATALPSTEWTCEITRGSPVLDIHIPAGGSLDLDECASSIHRGVPLLHKLFPDHDPVALVCEAWLLDPRLDAILPVDSSILGFARRFFRYTVSDDPQEAIARVFGERARTEGVARASRRTRFQRNLAEYVERGGKISAAGGFYRIADLPFRDGVYLHTF